MLGCHCRTLHWAHMDPHGPTLLSKIGGGMRDFLVRPILLVEDVTYSLSPHGPAFVHAQKERETEKELEREQGWSEESAGVTEREDERARKELEVEREGRGGKEERARVSDREKWEGKKEGARENGKS